jgi:serine/threonine protein kinase
MTTVTDTLVAGRYRVGHCLGAGGMGRVWLARDELLRRDVAIKEIALPFGLTDEQREEMRERTLREARAAARLNHPNVVRIYDVQPGHERPWIVMEYVPSRSLLEVIHENGPLPIHQVAGIGLAVLSALHAANRVGVIHRDVKPSNVLIAHDGRVVLTDFGSAMIDESEGALTRTGVILGSPRYISPERARNGIATPESDMWSLGATLYEAVEGRAPYTRQTTLETLVALATEKPDPIRRAGPLKPVLIGLLQKSPRARMSAADVEERLRRVADVQNAVRLVEVPGQPRPLDNVSPNGGTPGSPPRRPSHLGEMVQSGEIYPRAFPGADQLTGYAFREPLALPSAAPSAPAQATKRSVVRPREVRPHRWGYHRRNVVRVGIAAVVALALGVVAFAVAANRGSGPARADVDKVANTASTVAPPASAPAAPAAYTNVLPAGFEWYTGKSGFRVAHPARWVRTQEDRRSVTFCAPGGPPVVSVRAWNPSDPDLSLAMAREESAAALGSYHRIQMVVSPRRDGAVWEYTFTDPKMGRLHGLDRVVVAPAGTYLIQWRTPAAKWTENLDKLGVVTQSFHPAPTVAVAGTLPAGFSPYTSRSGFRVTHPTRWTQIEETDTSATFCAPGGPPVVTVRTWNPSDLDLAAAFAHEESTAKLGNYRRIGIQVLAGGQGGAWEYVFTDPKMGRLHGLDRAFLIGGRAYLIEFRTPANRWTENLDNLAVITNSFRAVTVGRTG